MTPVRPARVVLGYSGLDGSRELKLKWFPGLDEREARLFQGQDSAAALLVDGELVAAVQQERYSGLKFDHSFPGDAIDSCLRIGGIDIRDVEAVTHNFNYRQVSTFHKGDPYTRERYEKVYAPERQTELLRERYPMLQDSMTVTAVDHHRAHALTAAIPSGFDESLVVVADGMGELNAISVYLWRDHVLNRLQAQDFRASLGLFYSLLTMQLGFMPNSDEYKVMALAASGDAEPFADTLAEAIEFGEHGRLRVNVLSHNRDALSKETMSGSRRWLAERGCAERGADESLTQRHYDFAAAAQCRVEQAFHHIVSYWTGRTGVRRLALAGGVALNCVAVGKLAGSGLVDAVYVQPAAGDEGTAIGSALHMADQRRAAATYPAMTYLGPDVTELMPPEDQPHWWRTLPAERAEEIAATLLHRGCLVGWAQGRLEFGPRALGNRSILADPRQRAMKDRVNSAVKFRESFRPLAPAVLAERADELFVIPPGTNMRHMTVAVPVRPGRAADIPAVVHDDGTARVQCVFRDENPRFWRIIDRFASLTGVPVLMNTSLNVKGQPTARTGDSAFYTFTSSGLDVLFVADRVYVKAPWVAEVESLMKEPASA
jgi:carbamoyltransferase